MRHRHLRFGEGFKVILGDEHAQAARMTLAPGGSLPARSVHRACGELLVLVGARPVEARLVVDRNGSPATP